MHRPRQLPGWAAGGALLAPHDVLRAGMLLPAFKRGHICKNAVLRSALTRRRSPMTLARVGAVVKRPERDKPARTLWSFWINTRIGTHYRLAFFLRPKEFAVKNVPN